MSKVQIIPAILPHDFAELEDKVSMIRGLVKNVQVDICDGKFVPNFTWPYKKQDENFEKIWTEKEGLPGWQDIEYEFDLMVNNPEDLVDEWVSAGAARIILHAESKGNLASAILKLEGKVEVGLAINIETPLDILELHKERIQFVQCMGIDRIGFQGQSFDDKVLTKIAEIKSKYPEMTVSVDGGVSLETAPALISAGADRLVVGSALFNSENIVEALEHFKNLS